MATMIAQTIQMKQTAKALVVPTTFNAATMGPASPKAGRVMVIETVLTNPMKKGVTLTVLTLAVSENFSVEAVERAS